MSVGEQQAFEFFEPGEEDVDLGFFLDRIPALVGGVQFPYFR